MSDPATPLKTPEPLAGLQRSLDACKLLLREGLPGFAALKLHQLSRVVEQTADDLGDMSLTKIESEMQQFEEANQQILGLGVLG